VQREILMSTQLYNTLSAQKECVRTGPDDPVIVTCYGTRYASPDSISTNFWKLVKRIGLKGVSIHILRHTFASRQLQRGTPTLAVQALLGHSSESMTDRYAHPGDEYLMRVMGEFGTDPTTHSSTKHSTVSIFLGRKSV
jgi:integrase